MILSTRTWLTSPKVKRYRLPKLCRCKVTGKLFRPSFPSDYDEGQAFADTVAGKRAFYFREVRRVRRWLLPDYWQDTGAIWQPESWLEFEVLSQAAALEALELR